MRNVSKERFTKNQYFSRLTRVMCVIFGLMFFSPLTAGEQLVSNVEGKIQVVILHYGGESRFWFDETVLFRELLDNMDKDVGFVILHGKDYFGRDIKNRLSAYAKQVLPDGTPRVKYLEVETKTSQFYPWARDGYVILADEKGNLLFQDNGFNRGPFPITLFDRVFEGARTRAGNIHLGGGNIRACSDEIFLGIDTILGEKITPFGKIYSFNEKTLYSSAPGIKPKNLDSFKRKFEAHALRFKYLLGHGKKLVIPGKFFLFEKMKKGSFKAGKDFIWHTGAQAAYHTDVYLGIGHKGKDGKRLLFIADSNKGADIIEKMKPASRRDYESKIPGILESEGFRVYNIPLTAKQMDNRFEWKKNKLLDLSIKPSRKIGKNLDRLTKHLEKKGYRIVRIPSLANGLLDSDEKKDGSRGISFNYSNVLVEVYGDVKRVYMPQFGLKELDEAAVKAYQNAGYETVQIKGLLTNGVSPVEDGAGLDCMTSEIRFKVRWNKKYYKKK